MGFAKVKMKEIKLKGGTDVDILIDVLGMNVTYTQWNKKKKLPFYLAAGYDFQKAEIDGCFCLIIYPKEDLPTLPALKKQIQKIQQVENIPVVIQVKSMSAFRRKSMIENKISFIIEEKQVYLPFIAAYLQEKADVKIKVNEKFMFSAQVLFLMYIYQESEKLYLADATRQLPYSAMTITRAAKQLEGSGFFYVRKEGVNKILSSKLSKKELYEQTKSYLSSPIAKKGFLNKEDLTKQMLLAGTSALAEKTTLNSEALINYAVDKKACGSKELQKELIDPYKQISIEIWNYSPQLFAEENMVDTISLALSLMDERDERIEEAVDEMLEELWRNVDGNRISKLKKTFSWLRR